MPMSEQDKAQKDLEKENARKAKVQERELKRSASEKKELVRLEKEKAKPKRKTYFWLGTHGVWLVSNRFTVSALFFIRF